MTAPQVLSHGQLSRYEEEGFTFPVAVLSAAEVATYHAALAQTADRLQNEERPLLWANLHHSFRWACDLATHPRVLDAVEDLIGPEILIYSTLIFAKSGGEPHYVSWHQDGRFLLRDSEAVRALTAWIALSPSTAENGCLRIIPGSHHAGRLPHINTYAPGNMLLRGETVEAEFDEHSAVDLVLKPGEMSLHHVDAIHGSNANLSCEPRIGFTVRYLHPKVSTGDGHSTLIHARGGESKPACPSSDLDSAVAAHLALVTRTRAAIAAKEK